MNHVYLATAFTFLALLFTALDTTAGSESKPPQAARVVKVLTHFLDHQGRHSINPSLFDRDAYQFELRHNPKLRSGMRFDILWKGEPRSSSALTLKLELRGSKAPAQAPVIITQRALGRAGFREWTRVPVLGKDYEDLGELLAWRVSLWKDDQLVAEKASFLW